MRNIARFGPNLKELRIEKAEHSVFQHLAGHLQLPSSLTSLDLGHLQGGIKAVWDLLNPAEGPSPRLKHLRIDFFEQMDPWIVFATLRNHHHPLESLTISGPGGSVPQNTASWQEPFLAIKFNTQHCLRKLDISSLNWLNPECSLRCRVLPRTEQNPLPATQVSAKF